MAADDSRSTSEHDWHSGEYVEWWIARDQGRDAERRIRLREMVAQAGAAPDAPLSVLDVGGGYGVVSEEVAAAFPRARISLQDYSAPMLAAARQRLARFGERIAYILADLTDPGWVGKVIDPAGGAFDLAVSAIAIHNLRDLSLIVDAYRGVARALKPGGVFLDYDLFFDTIGGIERHLELLREAGFARSECLWRQPPLATLKAIK
jgi:ubiquinone/menaquinone biosynthesis C-methylase UbiE